MHICLLMIFLYWTMCGQNWIILYKLFERFILPVYTDPMWDPAFLGVDFLWTQHQLSRMLPENKKNITKVLRVLRLIETTIYYIFKALCESVCPLSFVPRGQSICCPWGTNIFHTRRRQTLLHTFGAKYFYT